MRVIFKLRWGFKLFHLISSSIKIWRELLKNKDSFRGKLCVLTKVYTNCFSNFYFFFIAHDDLFKSPNLTQINHLYYSSYLFYNLGTSFSIKGGWFIYLLNTERGSVIIVWFFYINIKGKCILLITNTNYSFL